MGLENQAVQAHVSSAERLLGSHRYRDSQSSACVFDFKQCVSIIEES